MALAVKRNMATRQMDIETAYLHGELKVEVYMRRPEGLDNGRNHFVRLKKALYSLKKFGRVWYQLLDDHLATHGFTRTLTDHSVYVRGKNEDLIIIGIWVDDLFTINRDQGRLDDFCHIIQSRFKMVDSGEAEYLLGIQILKTSKGIIMH